MVLEVVITNQYLSQSQYDANYQSQVQRYRNLSGIVFSNIQHFSTFVR
ncbi:hypothetical protein [Lactiplantibacillus plantarum]